MPDRGFKITIIGTERAVNCGKDESLLAALARQGYGKVRVGCRNGGCGVCKVRVTEGEFETGKMSIKHVTQAEREDNFTLSCRTFPKSDLTLETEI